MQVRHPPHGPAGGYVWNRTLTTPFPVDVSLLTLSKAPGKRCPNCREAGRETWVFCGRSCPICATFVS
ncbi:hypothetical protein F4678DRAFT_418501 [Xylaria arbuscula]|nr:hypothetical protein F4678DRAFT_418501 [Xylaria arbuscula]